MSERDKGEFELILGNKQLFSVLALVVILLGVFFAMGYLAGKSGGTAVADVVTGRKTETPSPPGPGSTKAVTSPAVSEPQPGIAKPEPAAEPPGPKPKFSDPQAAEGSASSRPSTAAAQTEAEFPPNGKYLQASALPKAQADAMLRLLQKDGIKAHLALSPKKKADAPDLYRILLGPLGDSSDIANARAYLKEKGIDKPIPRTYPDARTN